MKKFCEVCGNPIEDIPHIVPVIYRAKETEFVMCDKCYDKVKKMFAGGANLRPEMRWKRVARKVNALAQSMPTLKCDNMLYTAAEQRCQAHCVSEDLIRMRPKK